MRREIASDKVFGIDPELCDELDAAVPGGEDVTEDELQEILVQKRRSALGAKLGRVLAIAARPSHETLKARRRLSG
jgi:hypothetical protein